MNSRIKITIDGKPSQTQLKDWYENGIDVSFAESSVAFGETTKSMHNGKIKSYQPIGDDALLYIENSEFGVYLRNITSYTFTPKEIEPIFIDAEIDSPDKVGLIAEGITFWVNKKILFQRSEFFRAMYQDSMRESRLYTIDLTPWFSFQELEVLLLVANVGHCKVLTLEQAQVFSEVAAMVFEFEIFKQAQARISECLELINKEFLLAVLRRDYAMCIEMLAKGANINQEFGIYALGTFFCHHSDVPLTHAVKKEDEVLTKFLLDNGAKTEFDFINPLAVACCSHNSKIVKLLLEAGADPNIDEGYMMCEIFLNTYLLDRQEKAVTEIMKLLLDKGYAAKPADIAREIKEKGCSEKIINFFYKIWKNQNSNIDQAYTNGATAGVLAEKNLPHELGIYIGSFLDRRTGGRLSRVSRAAAQTAEGEEKIKVDNLISNSISKNQNLNIDQAYTNGATAGVLAEKNLPHELGIYVGSFLDRRTGGRLSRVSRRAVQTAKGEKERSQKKFI